jgi:hypothetical protein
MARWAAAVPMNGSEKKPALTSKLIREDNLQLLPPFVERTIRVFFYMSSFLEGHPDRPFDAAPMTESASAGGSVSIEGVCESI